MCQVQVSPKTFQIRNTFSYDGATSADQRTLSWPPVLPLPTQTWEDTLRHGLICLEADLKACSSLQASSMAVARGCSKCLLPGSTPESQRHLTRSLGGVRACSSGRADGLVSNVVQPIPGCYPGKGTSCSHKNLYTDILSSFICNSPNWKWHRCSSVDEWVNKRFSHIHDVVQERGMSNFQRLQAAWLPRLE